jgi:hypothetical protein
MESANFEQPLSAELEPTAALPFSGGRPVEGGWQVYPELAAGGMWCTPTDLVRFATGIQASYQGEHGAVIPQSLAVEMLTPQMPGWGLGVGLYGHSRSPWFGHTGGNAGYRCQFIASAERGPAVAVMTNSDEGGELVPAILNHLAGRSNWKGLVPRVDFDGSYETATGAILVLQAKAAGALLQVPGQDPLRFDVAEETRLVAAGGLISITLHLDLAGRASGLTLRQREGEVVATRRS